MRWMVLRFGVAESLICVALCCVIHALCLSATLCRSAAVMAPGCLGQVTLCCIVSTFRVTRHGLLWHVHVISRDVTLRFLVSVTSTA